MDLEGIMTNEINQAEKNKYSMVSSAHGIGKRQTCRNREQDGGYQGLWVMEMERCWSKGPHSELESEYILST